MTSRTQPVSSRRRRRVVLGGLAALASTSLAVAGLVAPSARAAGADHLLINEVYGGGGNAGATYTHDFVELYNPTSGAISVDGWKVQYYSATGNLGNSCDLTGSVAAGSSFLVQEAAGAGGTTALPAPDATCDANMSGTKGSVRIVDASGAVVDLVGYGATTMVEKAAAPALTNTTSAQRRSFTDTDDNSADFVVGAPSPTNSGAGGTTPTPTPTPPPRPPRPPRRPRRSPGSRGPVRRARSSARW
ncbi:lamin tail domain-containing protein [Acidipropionibacterium timonense]|uniref:lamin tail domain-containing protein n=1 Tax=Acidipropionibacterium timonense TaxID=2161818 RepID=UPI001AEC61A8|nr:lamin tail domain-containing protein [Acidipropionibacterium timonense]